MKFGAIFAPNYIIAAHDSAEQKRIQMSWVRSHDELPSYIKYACQTQSLNQNIWWK